MWTDSIEVSVVELAVVVVAVVTMIMGANAYDTNAVMSPCLDAKVQKSDGFTFGIAFSSRESFFFDQVQLSPCDIRLALPSKKMAQLAIFRPRVDEISLLTISSSTFDPAMSGGHMVAFAGRKYAARSLPAMIADHGMIITSFTLVLEFQQGTLQNLFWKSFGCDSCSHGSVCLHGKDCAVPSSRCGPVDCNLGIQLAFSGTDRNLESLNSWYEVSNLQQYSLHGLYSDLRDSINQVAGQS
ncbi:uncharacterized protein LOC110604486 [Manihot esculenta]|uniref:Uncharacterized protein n=1 Tax=Manihot esculenta TaxID=3983 RepID=A0ACB7G3R6_MANES|nr:uncharacterized protein LOC110604486 [Manihot esculenta]KAG8634867.1 hypothetical protein MANES_17G096100v8 [Manihot esculenta]